MSIFGAIASDLDELARAPHRAAAKAASELLQAVKAEFAGGQLRGLVEKTTASAEGPSIVLDFDDRLPLPALHDAPERLAEPVIVAALAEEGLR